MQLQTQEKIEKTADLICTRLAVFFVEQNTPVQEYQLMTLLQAEHLLDICSGDNYWQELFRKHFLVRHCLYKLNQMWAGQGRGLCLGPVWIVFYTAAPSEGLPSQDTTYRAMADYYGDLTHWLAATEATCRDFLDDFFRRFAALNDAEVHLTVLGLPKDAIWGVVQQQYRRLAQQHHPDKGGDAEQFLAITRAFEALKLLRGN
ncbi:MAG: hypothetical protein RL497_2866 [Pseudomonadota bacterium]|jgi:hypothetical protein